MERNIYELLDGTFDKRFHPKQYNMMFIILKKLHKNNNELLKEFFELKRLVSDDDLLYNNVNYIEIKEFFEKLNNVKLEDDLSKK